jgi:tetratricopeptide (TPR) repeat protein
MNAPDPAIIQSMQRASALLQAGNFVTARVVLERLVQAVPDFAEARRLLAGALLALGERAGAESHLRHAVAAHPDWAPAWSALGELLVDSARAEEGEQALRRAAQSGRYPRATYLLAGLLNRCGRYGEVVDLTDMPARGAQADHDLLRQRALAFLALGRPEDAIALYRRIVAEAPENGNAEALLAGALDSAGHHYAAEQSARRAIGKGMTSPETLYLHARTLIAVDRAHEAEELLCRVVAMRPRFADAQRDLAQLIWMRSADTRAACEFVEQALLQHANDDALATVKANLFAGAGDMQAALAFIEDRADSADADLSVLLCASQNAMQVDAQRALGYAQRAMQAAPAAPLPRRLLIEALLGIGDAETALHHADAQLLVRPDDQYLIALQTTAWRLLGDPRYADYCDYANFARGHTLDTPTPWPDLPAYLADLAASLKRLHTMRTHPLHQSLRHGSQTAQHLLATDDPAIRAFFTAIDAPLRRHIAALGTGNDPLRRRNRGGYRIAGIWSVRLPARGYHVDHVHPQGWLSSACYIELPAAMAAANAAREGHLKFGEPGCPTRPALAPEYFIRPEPGRLAVFPSYFWHGTVPFHGDDTRLTIAFDLVPD